MAFWANERSITFKGRFHYKEELQMATKKKAAKKAAKKKKR
jgi:hypothetical protein